MDYLALAVACLAIGAFVGWHARGLLERDTFLGDFRPHRIPENVSEPGDRA